MEVAPGTTSTRRLGGDLPVRGVVAVTQAMALAWFAPATRGLPLDDAWIHQDVARTFAQTGTLGLVAGEHGGGATSLAWAFLLGVNLRWLHLDPARWALALNVALALASGQILYALMARVPPRGVGPRPWAVASAVATVFAFGSGATLWFSYSGMEVNAFVFLSLVAVWARSNLAGGIAAGLALVVRPEAALLGVVVIVGRGTKRAETAAPWLASLVGTATLAWLRTGQVLPPTLGGRRWLWFSAIAGASRADGLVLLAHDWMLRLAHFVFQSGMPVLWIAVGLAAYGGLELARLPNRGLRLLLVWATLHTLSYAVLLPNAGHGGRYQPFVPLLFVLFTVAGSAQLAWLVTRVIARRARVDVVACAAVAWVDPLYDGAASMRTANDASVRHVEATELAMGRHVKALPPDAVVASFDIGGVAWAAERPIVDLGGLAEPRTLPLLKAGRTAELLAARKVTHLIVPGGRSSTPDESDFLTRLGLRGHPALRLEPLLRLESDGPTFAAIRGATDSAAPEQDLYAVTWSEGAPRVVEVAPSSRRALRDDVGTIGAMDRRIAEHMLGVLEAWGLPVDVRVTAEAVEPAGPGCAIALGVWGVAVGDCEERRATRETLFEMLDVYLERGDLGGATRALPHALTRALHGKDPSLAPALAPAPPPRGGASPIELTWRWGVALALAVSLAAILLGARRARVLAAAAAARLGRRSAALAAMLALLGCGPDAALARAAERGAPDVAAAIAAGAPLDARDASGRTAIEIAAGLGDAESVRLLASKGAAVGDALHYAVRRQQGACVTLLAGDVEHVMGPRRRTALHDAMGWGDDRVTLLLLRAGADPNRRDAFGATPLHLLARAAPARAAKLAPLLLAAGADPRLTDERGFDALHAAAATDAVGLVELLRARPEVTLEARSTRGETALDVALRYRAQRVVDALARSLAP